MVNSNVGTISMGNLDQQALGRRPALPVVMCCPPAIVSDGSDDGWLRRTQEHRAPTCM